MFLVWVKQSLSQFTPELLDHIAIETTTVDEIKAFIVFAILMGINKLPEIQDYWSMNDRRLSHPPETIFGALHLPPFCTNIAARGQPEYDWFAKVCAQ